MPKTNPDALSPLPLELPTCSATSHQMMERVSRMRWIFRVVKRTSGNCSGMLHSWPPKNQKIPINQAKFTKPARKLEKRKAWDRVLRATEGYFKNGVLNVKHLMEGHGTSKNG
ncbi:hypothetical protein AMTR_s00017p00143410 [Amborella trichopoda]|uniref:Uncharacterized protein n=1 Tax=Amborella trichopoda TaxID=13333 RepID=W1PKL6_AMBTC|nr:hypothetical protein AMTR_s00017p00143410 [Amborella trichopoda]